MTDVRAGEDRWWERVEPEPVKDPWMARQVISFHEKGDVPCAYCSRGLVCPRLTQARDLVARQTAPPGKA